MRVAIINYGMGNLGSVLRAFQELGTRPFIAEKPNLLRNADKIVLPGVGSFAEGASNLDSGGWSDEIKRLVREQGRPFLGICLGMQLLASHGCEGGDSLGLDLIPGEVLRLDNLGCSLRIPHVGWNSVAPTAIQSGLFKNIPCGTDFYFVHSYCFVPTCNSHILAYTDYGVPLAAAVGYGPVFGTQFHPEKSSKAGFKLLRNFLEFDVC